MDNSYPEPFAHKPGIEWVLSPQILQNQMVHILWETPGMLR